MPVGESLHFVVPGLEEVEHVGAVQIYIIRYIASQGIDEAFFHFPICLQAFADFVLPFVTAGYKRETVEEIAQDVQPVEVHRIH